jgi:hypothetical protein
LSNPSDVQSFRHSRHSAAIKLPRRYRAVD